MMLANPVLLKAGHVGCVGSLQTDERSIAEQVIRNRAVCNARYAGALPVAYYCPVILCADKSTSFMVARVNLSGRGSGTVASMPSRVHLFIFYHGVKSMTDGVGNTLVFIGHLHFDHSGDLSALLISAVSHGRNVPLRIWGPSGKSPELVTRYTVDRFLEALK